MSKSSQRRRCLISREEETLRWDLALGAITMDVFTMKMNDLDAKVNPKGVCGQCKDGLLIGDNYLVTCQSDFSVHHRHDSCENFRKDEC